MGRLDELRVSISNPSANVQAPFGTINSSIRDLNNTLGQIGARRQIADRNAMLDKQKAEELQYQHSRDAEADRRWQATFNKPEVERQRKIAANKQFMENSAKYSTDSLDRQAQFNKRVAALYESNPEKFNDKKFIDKLNNMSTATQALKASPLEIATDDVQRALQSGDPNLIKVAQDNYNFQKAQYDKQHTADAVNMQSQLDNSKEQYNLATKVALAAQTKDKVLKGSGSTANSNSKKNSYSNLMEWANNNLDSGWVWGSKDKMETKDMLADIVENGMKVSDSNGNITTITPNSNEVKYALARASEESTQLWGKNKRVIDADKFKKAIADVYSNPELITKYSTTTGPSIVAGNSTKVAKEVQQALTNRNNRDARIRASYTPESNSERANDAFNKYFGDVSTTNNINGKTKSKKTTEKHIKKVADTTANFSAFNAKGDVQKLQSMRKQITSSMGSSGKQYVDAIDKQLSRVGGDSSTRNNEAPVTATTQTNVTPITNGIDTNQYDDIDNIVALDDIGIDPEGLTTRQLVNKLDDYAQSNNGLLPPVLDRMYNTLKSSKDYTKNQVEGAIGNAKIAGGGLLQSMVYLPNVIADNFRDTSVVNSEPTDIMARADRYTKNLRDKGIEESIKSGVGIDRKTLNNIADTYEVVGLPSTLIGKPVNATATLVKVGSKGVTGFIKGLGKTLKALATPGKTAARTLAKTHAMDTVMQVKSLVSRPYNTLIGADRIAYRAIKEEATKAGFRSLPKYLDHLLK